MRLIETRVECVTLCVITCNRDPPLNYFSIDPKTIKIKKPLLLSSTKFRPFKLAIVSHLRLQSNLINFHNWICLSPFNLNSPYRFLSVLRRAKSVPPYVATVTTMNEGSTDLPFMAFKPPTREFFAPPPLSLCSSNHICIGPLSGS